MPNSYSFGAAIAEIALLAVTGQDDLDAVRLEHAIREYDAKVAAFARALPPGSLPASLQAPAPAPAPSAMLEPVRERLDDLIDDLARREEPITREEAVRCLQILRAMIPEGESATVKKPAAT